MILKKKSRKSNRYIKKQKSHITQVFELPAEAICGDFRIISISNKDIFIENHLGILQYTQKRLMIRSKEKNILFMGDDIVLKKMGKKNLIVQGKIDMIEFIDN